MNLNLLKHLTAMSQFMHAFLLLLVYCSESRIAEIQMRYFQNHIGCLNSDIGCANHMSESQHNRGMTKPFSPTNSPWQGGLPSLRLKGGSGRSSKQKESVKTAFQEPPSVVEGPPTQVDADEDEGTLVEY
jgi:hypothetical protein